MQIWWREERLDGTVEEVPTIRVEKNPKCSYDYVFHCRTRREEVGNEMEVAARVELGEGNM